MATWQSKETSNSFRGLYLLVLKNGSEKKCMLGSGIAGIVLPKRCASNKKWKQSPHEQRSPGKFARVGTVWPWIPCRVIEDGTLKQPDVIGLLGRNFKPNRDLIRRQCHLDSLPGGCGGLLLLPRGDLLGEQ